MSDLGDGVRVHYLLVMDNDRPFVIRPQDLGIDSPTSFVYEFTGSPTIDPASVQELNSTSFVTVPVAPSPGSNTPRYYRYFVISPLLNNDWVFLGEPNKIIAASRTRFTQVGVSPFKFVATVNVPNTPPHITRMHACTTFFPLVCARDSL
jgi:hypothetical protein